MTGSGFRRRVLAIFIKEFYICSWRCGRKAFFDKEFFIIFILQRKSDMAAEAIMMPMRNKKELRVLTVYAGKKG